MKSKTAFTLIELLLVVAVIALLVSLVLPALSGARDAVRDARCKSNLRQIAIAAAVYRADHKGHFPQTWEAYDLLQNPLTICPADERRRADSRLVTAPEQIPESYTLDGDDFDNTARNVIDTLNPAKVRVALDQGWVHHGRPWWRNVSYLDGHAARLP